MKKLFIVLFLLSNYTFSQVKPSTDITFQVVNNESKIIWQDVPFLGNNPHEGIIQLTSGTLVTSANGKAKGGNFVINMNSIVSMNIKSGKKYDGITDHLKSDDFFSTARYPTATFVITKIVSGTKPDQYTITGNLTIKGISKAITFPAIIGTGQDKINAQATVIINRTLWGITYKSYNLLAQMKDDMIPNDIQLTLNLVFSKVL